jgi:GR25 family glycosyltransferase involved in LPS biosynthesis
MIGDTAIYVINLDEDTERLMSISSQLKDQGLSFTRFPAIRGDQLPASIRSYFDSPETQSSLTRGEIGCYASHLRLHQMIAFEIQRPTLILEDDIEIQTDLVALLKQINAIKVNWDIIRLSNTPKRAVTAIEPLIADYQLVKYSRIPLSTGAYLITPAAAKKFFAWKMSRHRPIDQDLTRSWDCNLRTYGVMPPPIRPDIFDSSIDKLGRNMLRKKRKTSKLSIIPNLIRRMHYNVRFLGVSEWGRLFLINASSRIRKRFTLN